MSFRPSRVVSSKTASIVNIPKIDPSLLAQDTKPAELEVDEDIWKVLNLQARFPRDRFDWLGLDPNGVCLRLSAMGHGCLT